MFAIEWHYVIESTAVVVLGAGLKLIASHISGIFTSIKAIGLDVHVIKTNDLPHIQASLTAHDGKLGELQAAFIRHLDRPHTEREGDV